MKDDKYIMYNYWQKNRKINQLAYLQKILSLEKCLKQHNYYNKYQVNIEYEKQQKLKNNELYSGGSQGL